MRMRFEFVSNLVWRVPFDGETVAASGREAIMRVILAMAMMLFALAIPSLAQDDATPWRATVDGQIAAFQAKDGGAALEFAGAGFRTQFEGQPDAFYAAILASGYQPIVDSRSHSFGEVRKVSDTSVIQVVKLVGPDGAYYEALYQLTDEPDLGWRVQGVVLRKELGTSA